MSNKNIIMSDTAEITRNFKYSLGTSSVSFTVRIDVKKHLKQMVEMLEVAIKDMNAQLAKIDKEE